MASSASSLVFSVQRRAPVLLAPAKPTLHEFKHLSDIDDQDCLRFHVPSILFYRYDPKMGGRDPVQVLRNALAEALVFYYPFAGRLREGPGRKLMVECTGEGIMFIEANAYVTLEQFGEELQPPFPCLEELLYGIPGAGDVLNCPLLLIQVTRLMCGGFIFSTRVNHTMCDAIGLTQFMTAVGEIARGACAPSILPVWQREVLNARNPPQVSCVHHEFDAVPNMEGTLLPIGNMAHRSFFFGPKEMYVLRKHVPMHLCTSSRFEVLTACLWRCRTVALQLSPEEEVRVIFVVNARGKFIPPLPVGYYGNVIANPAALTTAGKLCQNPLEYALELVRKAKADVTEEYMRSVADLLVMKGRPHFSVFRAFLVSNMTHSGFGEVDLGWGKPVYGGPAEGGAGAILGVASFYRPFRNKEGESGIVVPISLPGPAMERFVLELEIMIKEPTQGPGTKTKTSIVSAL